MKHCNICNTDFPDNLSFCTNCGSKLVDKPNNLDTSNSGTASESDSSHAKPPVKPKKKVGKIIRRVLIGIVVIVVALFLWGSHLINSTTYLTFNSQGALFAKSGGEAEVSIDYDGYVWEVNYKPSWVEIDEYDSSFRIRCNPNQTGQDREDHITIKSGKIVQALPVGQYGSTQYIRLSESDVSSDMYGESIHVSIETDGSDPEISYPEFCSIEDKTPEGFTLVVKENDDYSRSGIVSVEEDNVVASISVTQKGKCSECGGDGEKACFSCGGVGSTGWGMYMMNCYACGGNGYVKCYSCSGTGIR